MATIDANIAAVRTAIFGKDVREAIADSVSQLYDKTQEFEDIVEELERENSVQEYANMSSFPNVGESNVIYVDKSANILYRWTGTTYAELSSTLRLGETSTTAFPGNRGLALETGVSNLNTNIGTVPSGKTVEGQISELSGAIGTVPSGKTVEGQISELSSTVSAKYVKPSTGIPITDLATSVTDKLSLANTAYQKPNSGIPASDLAPGTIPDVSGKADKANTVLDNTISMGRKANTTVGVNSTALGSNVEASGNYSHAEGEYTTASGIHAHAEGSTSIASGNGSHAEGTHTRAVGEYSHAGGYYGYANTEGSFAHGQYVSTHGKYETVFGVNNAYGGTSFPTWVAGTEYRIGNQVLHNGVVYECNTYNVDSSFDSSKWDECPWTKKEAFIIGGGKHGYDQKNVFEVYWDGTVNSAKDINFKNAISGFRKDGTVVGEYSAAFGEECEATGSSSFAAGWGTSATQNCAFAEGNNTIASGSNSHAEGMYTTASGEASHAEGYNTTASGGKSHAEGTSTTASGAHSSAHGYWTKANGDCTSAFGKYNADLTMYPAWESGTTYNVGDIVTIVNSGVVRGYRCNTQNSDAAFTNRNWDSIEWNSKEAFVIGNGESANSKSNAFEVYWDGTAKASGEVYANGKQLAHAEDVSAKADKVDTVLNTTLSMGRKVNTVVGSKSVALGDNVEASGASSHAEGSGTTASAAYSHAEGRLTTASDMGAHAEGYTTTASGGYSHAEGSTTTASGGYSHAEGSSTVSSGDFSHAEGSSTVASGDASHSCGLHTEASTRFSCVMGMYNKIEQPYPDWESGKSYAVGDKVNQRIMGTGYPYECKVANSDTTFTSSKWTRLANDGDIAFVIGNGTSNNARSNAFEVYWNGTIKAKRIILESPNGTAYTLSVLDNGTLSINQVTT